MRLINNKKIEGGQFDPFGDNDDNDNDDNDNDDDEKSFLKALQLRWGALKNGYSEANIHYFVVPIRGPAA